MAGSERQAPEFPTDARWLGVEGLVPRFDADLSGRALLCCFWTAPSMLCESALATLAWLELQFAGRPLVVLSVHGARHPADADEVAVASAMSRFRVRHPVCVDDGKVRASWAVESWPELVLVDGGGKIRFQGSGTPRRERLAAAIDALCDECSVGPPSLPAAVWPGLPPLGKAELLFPAGLAIDPLRRSLWISDGGRSRLLEVALDNGVLKREVGCGLPGFADGDPGIAAFAAPRGICIAGDSMFVADSGNHALRKVDLDSGRVETWVGTGRPSIDRAGGAVGDEQGLDGPSDVGKVGELLFVALANARQIWSVGSERAYAEARVGSGEPGARDGSGLEAAFGEPLGVAGADGRIAIADRRAGSLRVYDLDTDQVATWIEPGGLQGPCGLAWYGRAVLVCETAAGRVVRVDGPGAVPEPLGDVALCRPEALAVDGDRVWIADTGHHRVLRLDLESGKSITFEPRDPQAGHGEVPEIAELRAGAEAVLSLRLPRPDGARIDDEVGPWGVVGSMRGDVVERFDGPIEVAGDHGILHGVPTGVPGSGVLRMVLRYATRSGASQVEHVLERDLVCGVRLTPDGPERMES